MLRPTVLIIGLGGVLLLGGMFATSTRKPSPTPTAEEIDRAIFESEQNYHDAVLASKIEAARKNPRQLYELWQVAMKYRLPHHAETVDEHLSTILLPKAEYAYRKKHITTLMNKAPERSKTWQALKKRRDAIERP